MNPAIVLLGSWIAFDGAGSIIVYHEQSFHEQLVRIARIIVGTLVAVAGITVF